MSNLIPAPGQSPILARAIQPVEVREFAGSSAQGDEIDLRELWRALKRRKRVVGTTFAAVLVFSGCFTLYQRIFKPVYEGGFQLLITDPISDENRGGAGGGEISSNSMIESLAKNSTTSDIPTLIEVLKSPMLLAPIASRFNTTSSSLANQVDIKSGGTKQKEAEGVLSINLTDQNPERASALLEAIKKDYLGYSLKQRQQRLNDGLRFLDRQAPALQAKTGELQAQLALFRQKNNQLLPTEEGAAQKVKIAGIEDQLRLLQVEELRLQSMRKSIEAGRLTARSFQDNAGGSGAGGTGGGVNVTVANPSLLEQLTKVEEQLAEARAKFRAESPTVRSLTARRDQLLPLLKGKELDAVDAALAMNNTKISAVQNQEKTLTREFQKQPQLIKQYEALNQKLTIAQENLAGFIKARENFQLEIAQRTVPWQVIAPAEINPNPVKPSIPRNLALGAVLGLVAGAAAGLIRDRMDHVFHQPGEVQQELQQPLLGHIPHVEFFAGVREEKRFLLEELDNFSADSSKTKVDSEVKASDFNGYQRFFYQEAFRNLFSSLRFLNSDSPIRSIAITSSLPTEGKSLVNILLAKTISEMGQRVLLIDADLRKPQLHHRLGQDNITGLSNLLTDDGDLHWRQAIQPVKGRDNWWVITAGRRPPDPARLLSSHRMGALVDDLSKSGDFDLIIYDTPPVLGLADAMLVAEHLDGIILLVSLARVDRGLPKESIQRIRSAGAPLLGIVTNAVKKESRSSTAYGYGYGYGYGQYGYGAYDAGHAYNYYSNDNDPEEVKLSSSKDVPGNGSAINKSRNLKQKFMRWIDG